MSQRSVGLSLGRRFLRRIDRPDVRPHIPAVPKRIAFITPAAAVLKRNPPEGPQWIHEVKFDGWRMQLHKIGDRVVVFSRNGIDMTRRFAIIRDKVLSLTAQSAIIDAELVACDSHGKPDFNALMDGQRDNLCAWCFDLLELDGRDLRTLLLVERKAALRDLLIAADDDALRYSDEFDDPAKLLAVVTEMGLEGVVSKLGHQPYKSGKNVGWIKVKSQAWRDANREHADHLGAACARSEVDRVDRGLSFGSWARGLRDADGPGRRGRWGSGITSGADTTHKAVGGAHERSTHAVANQRPCLERLPRGTHSLEGAYMYVNAIQSVERALFPISRLTPVGPSCRMATAE